MFGSWFLVLVLVLFLALILAFWLFGTKKDSEESNFVVPEMGLEPIWISPFDFKSNAYTNSAIRAQNRKSILL